MAGASLHDRRVPGACPHLPTGQKAPARGIASPAARRGLGGGEPGGRGWVPTGNEAETLRETRATPPLASVRHGAGRRLSSQTRRTAQPGGARPERGPALAPAPPTTEQVLTGRLPSDDGWEGGAAFKTQRGTERAEPPAAPGASLRQRHDPRPRVSPETTVSPAERLMGVLSEDGGDGQAPRWAGGAGLSSHGAQRGRWHSVSC